MDAVGLIFLTLVVLMFIGLILLVIPEYLGHKVGIWVVTQLRPSWPQGRLGPPSLLKLSGWRWVASVFIAIATVEIAFENLVPEAPNLPSIPYLVFTSLQQQRLQQEPVHLMIYSTLIITAFFFIGFASIFFSSWHRFRRPKLQ